MGSLARSLRRSRERLAAADYRSSEEWGELLEFCRQHSGHGEMEFQAAGDERHMACLLCSKSFDCGELPERLFKELLRRFEFSMWLEA